MKKFAFDLVILNKGASSYCRAFQLGSERWRGRADLCRSSAQRTFWPRLRTESGPGLDKDMRLSRVDCARGVCRRAQANFRSA